MDKKFIFGVSTSAFQIEGDDGTQGRGLSVWDTFCEQPGTIYDNHNGKLGVDHYNRYKEDVGILADLGVNAYRFSVSWPRVLPNGTGAVNQKGIDFYDRLIDSLLEKGIEPVLTEYHWDMPETLGEKGGLRNPDYSDWFEEYTAVLLKKYSDRVQKYITYNEPICAVHASYRAGVFAPGLTLTDEQAMGCVHNFNLGHGKAGKLIMSERKDAEVSIAMSVWDYFPDSEDSESIENTRKAFFYKETPTESIDNYLDPIYLGCYPERISKLYPRFFEKVKDSDMKIIHNSSNVLGVNYYHGVPHDKNGKPIGRIVGAPSNDIGHVLDPRGLYWDCRYLVERYKKPIYITENGTSSIDHVSIDGNVHDAYRVDYLARHLKEMERLIKDGIDLRGYYVWSLMDNFEWLSGYSVRFGLVHVDYQTMKRTKKDSFEFYKNYIENFSLEKIKKGV